MTTPARVLVGTAGWSYPDWENVVYPPGKTATRLRTIAEYLDCIEVDSSFYRPPSPRTTENWVKNLADRPGFRFLAKAWQRFTHERTQRWTPTELDLFTRGLAPLREADRLDALLFQFPWSFRNDATNRDWLAAIADSFAGWPVAVEVRHDSWDDPEIFRRLGMIFCNIDQPQLNHCLPPTGIVTAPTGYYRLHGRNARNWFRGNQDVYGGRYDYLYSDAELDELLPKINLVAAQTKKLFVIFNNHKDGKAFANALQLRARLGSAQPVRAPTSLLRHFPALRARVLADGEEQLPLV